MTKTRDVLLRGAIFATKPCLPAGRNPFKKIASLSAVVRNDTVMNAFILLMCILLCGCRAPAGAAKYNDEETQSAVEAITHAVSGSEAGVKYCPVDGQRFSSKIIICPVHKAELKPVGD